MPSNILRVLILVTFPALLWLFWVLRLDLQFALWLPSFALVMTYWGVVWITSLLFATPRASIVYPLAIIAIASSGAGTLYMLFNPSIDASVWQDGVWPLAHWALASTLSVAPILLIQVIRSKLRAK
jgi:hypothetical protein